jgi:mono/diheme cytochrome c family protein
MLPFLSASLLWVGAPLVLAESSRSHGAALVHACAACHGPDGQSRFRPFRHSRKNAWWMPYGRFAMTRAKAR